MNEIIKDYIRQTNCKIVVNITKYINTQHSLTNGWCHVGISFAMLECVWESNVEINCKEVAYSCMWVTPYIWYCIQYRMFVATTTTCSIALKAI
jgi:hypothetical protein